EARITGGTDRGHQGITDLEAFRTLTGPDDGNPADRHCGAQIFSCNDPRRAVYTRHPSTDLRNRARPPAPRVDRAFCVRQCRSAIFIQEDIAEALPTLTAVSLTR